MAVKARRAPSTAVNLGPILVPRCSRTMPLVSNVCNGWKATDPLDNLYRIEHEAEMLITILLMAAAPAQANPVNPLTPAEQGMVQCWSPDLSKKTCRVIASYRKTGPGTYDNEAIVGLSPEGPLTVETHTPVTLSGDAVCGAVKTQDIRQGTLRRGQNLVGTAVAQHILNRVATLMAPLDGKETCTRYSSAGGKLTAKIWISGAYHPEDDTEVKWISPADGYIIVP